MAAGDRLAGLARLACRVAARRGSVDVVRAAAVHEQLDARVALPRAREPRVVRRALVAGLRRGRQRIVHDEAARVGEDRAQHARRRRGLDRPVQQRREVRGREVDAPVGGVGRGADGRRVRGPHRRGRRGRRQERRRLARRTRDDVGVAARRSRARAVSAGAGARAAATPPGESHATRSPASWRAPAAPLRAGSTPGPRAASTRRCRATCPSSCASGRGGRRTGCPRERSYSLAGTGSTARAGYTWRALRSVVGVSFVDSAPTPPCRPPPLPPGPAS